MAFGKKIVSSLKNAFSYVVHRESADDHARKPKVVEALMASSLPLGDESPEYAARLYQVLSKTSTKTLDLLTEKQVAVMLDARLEQARERAAKVEGVYYPAPQGAAAGGIVTLYDPPAQKGFFAEPAWHGPLMLDELRRQFGEKGLPQAPLYASVSFVASVGDMGAVVQTTRVDWGATPAAAPKVGAPPLKTPKP